MAGWQGVLVNVLACCTSHWTRADFVADAHQTTRSAIASGALPSHAHCDTRDDRTLANTP